MRDPCLIDIFPWSSIKARRSFPTKGPNCFKRVSDFPRIVTDLVDFEMMEAISRAENDC